MTDCRDRANRLYLERKINFPLYDVFFLLSVSSNDQVNISLLTRRVQFSTEQGLRKTVSQFFFLF